MPESEGTTDLEALVEEAEQQKSQFNEARNRLQKVREELRSMSDTLHEEGTVTGEEYKRVQSLIDSGEYGDAREAIEQAASGETLAFEDDEKDQFATAFARSWSDLETAAEEIRTALLDLRSKNDMSNDDLVSYLYGKHYNLRKSDIESVFDALGVIERTSLSTNDLARVLAAFDYDLNVSTAEDVLEAIEAEA